MYMLSFSFISTAACAVDHVVSCNITLCEVKLSPQSHTKAAGEPVSLSGEPDSLSGEPVSLSGEPVSLSVGIFPICFPVSSPLFYHV